MFIINWVFGELGYVPKVSICIATPVKTVPKTKPKVAKKPAVKRTSTRKPKAKQ